MFRRLHESGFDFTQPRVIDFNVDFPEWPPVEEALKALRANFGKIALHEPDENGAGYVQFQIEGSVKYETVMDVQKRATELTGRLGGICESWGVFE